MLVFIVGAASILTLLAVILALLVPEPRPNIILMDQIGKQLPGMIISGISIGFVYSMAVALGYTLVYGVLKFINFAHSEIFMVGSVIGFEVMRRIEDAGFITAWHPVMLVITVVGSGMIGERLARGFHRTGSVSAAPECTASSPAHHGDWYQLLSD